MSEKVEHWIKGKDFRRINEIIDTYHSIGNDFNDIDGLLSWRRELSCIAVKLADYVGYFVQNYKAMHGSRKIMYNKARYRFIEAGESAAKADIMASNEIAKTFDDETVLEGSYARGKLLLESIHKCLDAMAGQINYLKYEKPTVNHRDD